MFDFACPLFEEGKTDPRLLIQLFGEMKDIIRNDDDFTIYSGVKAVIERLGSIEDIGIYYNNRFILDINFFLSTYIFFYFIYLTVSRNLAKNHELESAQDTQKLLIANAKEMLQKFLTKDREQRLAKGIALKHEGNGNILRVEI